MEYKGLDRLQFVSRRRRLKRVVALLCALVMLLTVDTLKKNADTLERIPTCGFEEHVHEADCYDEAGEPVCGLEEHVHTDACYQESPTRTESEEEIAEPEEDFVEPEEEIAETEEEIVETEEESDEYEEEAIESEEESTEPEEEAVEIEEESTEPEEEAVETEEESTEPEEEAVETEEESVEPEEEAVETEEESTESEEEIVETEEESTEPEEEIIESEETSVETEEETVETEEASAEPEQESAESVEEAAEPEIIAKPEKIVETEQAVESAQEAAPEQIELALVPEDGATEEVQPEEATVSQERVEASEPEQSGDVAAVPEQAEAAPSIHIVHDLASSGDASLSLRGLIEGSSIPEEDAAFDETGDVSAEEAPDDVETGEAPTEIAEETVAEDAEELAEEASAEFAEDAAMELEEEVSEDAVEDTAASGESDAPGEDAGIDVPEEIEALPVEAVPVDAAPAEAEAELGAPVLAFGPVEYDAALLAVEAVDDDYIVTPVADFETTDVTWGRYVFTLLNGTAPVRYPAQSFAGSTDYVSVSVEAGEGAFPAGTTMTVADIDDEATIEGITEKVEQGFVRVERVHAVDIAFYDAEGAEIEPLIPISVVMTVREVEQDRETVVVHVDDDAQAEIIEADADALSEAEAGDCSVGFVSDAFSVYSVVVGQRIDTKVIDADGNAYYVEVTYAEDAHIPAGATLSVAEVTEDGQYLARARERLAGNKLITLARFFDIRIMDGDREVQPDAPVEVRIWLDGKPAEIDLTEDDLSGAEDADEEATDAHTVVTSEPEPSALHFTEQGSEGPETADARESADAVVFFADGFSVWGVVYTVDFYYGNYEWHMGGGESMLLSALFEKLGIEADAAAAVDVQFTDDELLAVEKVESDWLLTSLAPFDTEETLTVTMEDGTEYVVRVEDAQYSLGVYSNQYSGIWFNGRWYQLGAGTVSASNTNIRSQANETAAVGSNVTKIEATPDANSTVLYWLLDNNIVYDHNGLYNKNSGNGGTIYQGATIAGGTLDIGNSDGHSVQVVFVKAIKSLTVNVDIEGLGNVVKTSSDGEAETISTLIIYDRTSNKQTNNTKISAKPSKAYDFDYWDLDNILLDITDKDIISKKLDLGDITVQHVLTAHFKELEYTVRFKTEVLNDNSSNPGRGGTMLIGSSTTGVTEGEILSHRLEAVQNGQIAEAVPDKGYRCVGWKRNDEEGYLHWGDVKLYKSYLPDYEDCTFTAVFEKITSHTVYYHTNGTYGSVSHSEEEALFSDDTQQFLATGSTATAIPGYRFVCWVDKDCAIVSENATFVPTGDQIYEEATYTAVFEPANYAHYFTVTADAPSHGYVESLNYPNAVNGRIVSMYIQDDGTIPAEITARAYEEWLFDHWELNGMTLRADPKDESSASLDATLGKTINFKNYGCLKEGKNALVACYVKNDDVPVHTIIYKAAEKGTVQGHAGSKNDDGDYCDTWIGSNFSSVLGAKAIPSEGWMFAGWKVQVKTTVTEIVNGVETKREVLTDVFPSYYADYIPTLDQIPDLSQPTVFTATFRPTGSNATDSGKNGMVGYNMNVANVPVYWNGKQDLVIAAANTSQTTTNYSTMYYDTNGGQYYSKGEVFHPELDTIPEAEGYFFVGWYNKNRPKYVSDDGLIVQEATEGTIIPRGTKTDNAGNNYDAVYFPYAGNNGSRYTFEAVFIGIKGESKRLPYDGQTHALEAFDFFEAGSVSSVSRYKEQLEAIKNNNGYDMSNVKYQLLEKNGVPVTGEEAEATDSFSRIDPGLYKVRAFATCTWSGEQYTIYKDITLEIYPARVIIKKIWNDNDDAYAIRPSDLAVQKLRYDPLDLYREKTAEDSAVSRVVDTKNLSEMAAAKAEAKSLGSISSVDQLYGPRSGAPTEDEVWSKDDSVWTVEYDDVLVRNNGFGEDDQTSGYYLHFAEETVPFGYEQVNETWERSDDMLTTTITFTNQPRLTDFSFTKEWENSGDSWPKDAQGEYVPITVSLTRYFQPEAGGSTQTDGGFGSKEFTLSPGDPVTQNGYVVTCAGGTFTIVGLQEKAILSGVEGHWVYQLSESAFDGYTTSYSYNSEVRPENIPTGGVIRNTLITYTMPSTGGTGTTLFRVAGALLALAAAVLLIVKRRMGRDE